MAVSFARESLTDALWNEAFPLLVEHWREVSHFQDIPLDPDRRRYQAFEQAGILRCFTARQLVWQVVREQGGFGQNEEHRLVGYALYIVNTNPHYQSSLQAVQDVLYLAKDQRGRTALKFIDWCDDQLRAEGVQATYQHLKAAHEHGHRALQHLGYVEVDRIYAKRLDMVGAAEGANILSRLWAEV